ncbi:MAG: DUF4230 domain-containing protein [Chloroflexi bacterium]|nr:DUF4230 domain-containing protein [Chloroflexota bacterium]
MEDFFPTEQPAPPPKPPPRSPVGCYVVGGLMGLALVFAALVIAGAIRDASKTVAEANPANIIATLSAPQTPTIVVRPPAIRQVRALADLTTVSSLMSTVVDVQQARIGNMVYEKLILIACGRVKAGVDLSKLHEEDVVASADGLTVTINLPDAEVQDAYLIDDSTQPCTTKVYDRSNLILIPQTKELESQAREEAVKAIREMAIQSGMLSEADRNARAVIERVLLLAGYQYVEFVESSPTPQPVATPTITPQATQATSATQATQPGATPSPTP